MGQNRSIARILGIVQESAQQASQISLPRVSNRLGLAAMGVATVGVGAALTRLRPATRGGRSDRFQELIEAAVQQAVDVQVAQEGFANLGGTPWTCDSCEVQVNEGFGKPSMVSFALAMVSAEEGEEEARAAFARKILEAAVRTVWRNPEIAPIVIQGSLRLNQNDSIDMRDLGYSSLHVRPEELFERLGAPAIDRSWHPL